jgi:hypothetical protein
MSLPPMSNPGLELPGPDVLHLRHHRLLLSGPSRGIEAAFNSALRSKLTFYFAFTWARRALDSPFRRGQTVKPAKEAARCMDCIADCAWHSVAGCMLAQVCGGHHMGGEAGFPAGRAAFYG